MMQGALDSGDLIYGDFEVLGFAGAGATSNVYRCRPRRPGLPDVVAVKVLHNRFVFDPVARRRFLNEAALMKGLDHQNVVGLFDIIEAPGVVAFVMEHIEGPTLLEWQAQANGEHTDQELCEVFVDILNGVGFAHSKGILHRDLKPANILLDTTGLRPVAKIIDFGVARLATAAPDPEELNTIRGTAAYISPDEIRSPFEVCPSSDLYSLGVMLYELAAGTRPFKAKGPQELLQAHLTAEPTRPSLHNPSITPELESVIMRALAKRPDQRFTDASSLRGALQQALNVAWEIRTEQWARPTLPPPRASLRALTRPALPIYVVQIAAMLLALILNPGNTDMQSDPHYLSRAPVELPSFVY